MSDQSPDDEPTYIQMFTEDWTGVVATGYSYVEGEDAYRLMGLDRMLDMTYDEFVAQFSEAP